MTFLHRRLFLRGLVAAPAVVAIGSLMPIRGIVMPTQRVGIWDWDKLDSFWLFPGDGSAVDVVTCTRLELPGNFNAR